jgi:uncharacterized membrane-anchored protein YhcB (DUF1043 family)
MAVITGIAGLIIGAVVMFFVMRNNPKYFNIDDILKAKRDELSAIGKDKLAELKAKIDELL